MICRNSVESQGRLVRNNTNESNKKCIFCVDKFIKNIIFFCSKTYHRNNEKKFQQSPRWHSRCCANDNKIMTNNKLFNREGKKSPQVQSSDEEGWHTQEMRTSFFICYKPSNKRSYLTMKKILETRKSYS